MKIMMRKRTDLSAHRPFLLLAMMLLPLLAILSTPAEAQSSDRVKYFERVAKAMERRNDATGAAWIRELGLGERIVPRTLSEPANGLHPQYAGRYEKSRQQIRDAIIDRFFPSEEHWRIDRAEAALHLVSYELEQGSSANEADVRTFLSDAEWMLSGFFRGAPPPRRAGVQLPEAELSVMPERITKGETAILTWTTVSADRVILNGQSLTTSGSMLIHPESSTYYGLTAYGNGGTAEASAAIEVRQPKPTPPPRVTLTANPARILRGNATRLRWTSRYATKVTLDGQSVPPSGSQFVNPVERKLYVLTAEGTGGSAATSFEVDVIAPPPMPAARTVATETKPIPFPPVAPATPLMTSTTSSRDTALRNSPRDTMRRGDTRTLSSSASGASVAAAVIKEPLQRPYIFSCDGKGRPIDSTAWSIAYIVAQRLRNDTTLVMTVEAACADTTMRNRTGKLRAAMNGAIQVLTKTFRLPGSRFKPAPRGQGLTPAAGMSPSHHAEMQIVLTPLIRRQQL